MARWDLDTRKHDAPGSAVGKDSDEALRLLFWDMPFQQGTQTLATVYTKGKQRMLLSSCNDQHCAVLSAILCLEPRPSRTCLLTG